MAERDRTQKARPKSPLRDILEVIVPAFIIFLVVRTFFFESRWVPTPSMVPTIMERERFIENKIVYRFRRPRRGEIIVFHPPAGAMPGGVRRDDLVKRVVGLPGETVEIKDGTVYIDGRRLPEPYVKPENRDYLSFGPFHVPAGHLFVLGDNRRQSRDSRYWLYLPLKNVTGKAFWRFWPPNRLSILR